MTFKCNEFSSNINTKWFKLYCEEKFDMPRQNPPNKASAFCWSLERIKKVTFVWWYLGYYAFIVVYVVGLWLTIEGWLSLYSNVLSKRLYENYWGGEGGWTLCFTFLKTQDPPQHLSPQHEGFNILYFSSNLKIYIWGEENNFLYSPQIWGLCEISILYQ